MRYRAIPSTVSGTIRAPPSKSVTHRAIVMTALSGGPCRIRHALRSEDTDATASGMEAFGVDIATSDGDLRVSGGPLQAPALPIDARNSGTTLRFLAGVASLLDGTTILTGDPSLRKRPVAPLLEALQALGARAESLGGGGSLPIRVGGALRGGSATIPGGVSSQFLSSLLIACPLARNPSEIRVLPPVRSEPYVEMTRRLMRRFGVDSIADRETYRVGGGQRYVPIDVDVPGDFSSAAFPLAAAALTGGDVTVSGLEVDGPQGDRRVVEALRSFGARIDVDADRVRARGGDLVAQTVDVGDTPDLFPVLAVLATQAAGESRFINGSHLRWKESDRIDAVVSMLRTLGAPAQATEDGCRVRGPSRLRGAFVDARGDHRVLMAAAVAGLAAEDPVDISDPWCFRVSYPTFLDDLRSLGALHAVVG